LFKPANPATICHYRFAVFQVEIIVNNTRCYVAFIDSSDTSKAVFDLLPLELNVARLSLSIKNPETLSSYSNYPDLVDKHSICTGFRTLGIKCYSIGLIICRAPLAFLDPT
jgi:hypothetical protein